MAKSASYSTTVQDVAGFSKNVPLTGHENGASPFGGVYAKVTNASVSAPRLTGATFLMTKEGVPYTDGKYIDPMLS